MTLSLSPENYTVKPARLNFLAHHDEFDKPESGCTLNIGGVAVHLSGEETIRLGRFLMGGHAELDRVLTEADVAPHHSHGH
jgi:hypothetical protein